MFDHQPGLLKLLKLNLTIKRILYTEMDIIILHGSTVRVGNLWYIYLRMGRFGIYLAPTGDTGSNRNSTNIQRVQMG